MSNAPVKKLRLGYLSVNVWENEKPNGDGKWYSVEIQRTYKDENGELKNTNAMNPADCLNAAFLLQRANAWIMDQ